MIRLNAALLVTALFCSFASAKDAATDFAAAGEIRATGFLAASQVKKDEPVRFWLTIQNHLTQSVSGVRLDHLDAAGFKLARRCWCGGAPAACGEASRTNAATLPSAGPGHEDPACDLLAAELKPGQTITIWGDLEASEVQANSTLTAVIGWKNPDQSLSETAVALGACSVTDGWGRWSVGAATFLKDIGVPLVLPLVLLVLSWRFKVWDAEREKEKQKQEKKRDQAAEQWSIMLPDSRKLSRRYYLPLLSAVTMATGSLERVAESLKALAALKDEAARRQQERQLAGLTKTAFFYWVLSWRQLRNVADSVGGLHFKDRVGEKLSAWCQSKFISLYLGDDPHQLRVYARILDHIDIHEKLDSFLAKLDADLNSKSGVSLGFQEGWHYFRNWVRKPSCEESILYLKGFAALVEYEANRPFEYWYGGVKERINLDPDAKKTLRCLAAEIAASNPAFLADFSARVDKYIAEGEASS